MIIVAPPLFAADAPATNFAMFVRIGVSGLRLCTAQRLQKLLSYQPEVCRVVSKSILLRLEIGPRHHNRHMLGSQALNFCDKLGIQAKLENGSGLRFAREPGRR